MPFEHQQIVPINRGIGPVFSEAYEDFYLRSVPISEGRGASRLRAERFGAPGAGRARHG